MPGQPELEIRLYLSIERKMGDYYEVRNRPRPYEMNMYYQA